MIRFSGKEEFTAYLLNAVKLPREEVFALHCRIDERKLSLGREFAEYIDYDPFRAFSYPNQKPGDFVVIHGHHVGEPKPRIIVQHLY